MLVAASVFGHKTEPSASAVGGLGNPHDPWNRLHVTPASFPSGSSWAKGPEKRDDRGKEVERRELTHIKDEKDRYGITTTLHYFFVCNLNFQRIFVICYNTLCLIT